MRSLGLLALPLVSGQKLDSSKHGHQWSTPVVPPAFGQAGAGWTTIQAETPRTGDKPSSEIQKAAFKLQN